MGWIYALSDPRDGVTRYIGQTKHRGGVEGRRQGHIGSTGRVKAKTHLMNWLRALEADGVEPHAQTLAVVENEYLDYLEVAAIASYRAHGYDLVNTAVGGTGGPLRLGMKNPNAQKEAARRRWQGTTHTPTARAKLRTAALARGTAHLNTPDVQARAQEKSTRTKRENAAVLISCVPCRRVVKGYQGLASHRRQQGHLKNLDLDPVQAASGGVQ